jgi:hypothetical protein
VFANGLSASAPEEMAETWRQADDRVGQIVAQHEALKRSIEEKWSKIAELKV